MNGLVIGASAAVLIIALIAWNSLDSTYWDQYSVLINQKLEPSTVNFLLSSTVGAISVCGAAAVFAVYLLVFFSLSQVSPSYRTLMNGNTKSVRVSNLFLSIGVISLVFVTQYGLWNVYQRDFVSPYSLLLFSIFGGTFTVVGIVLLASAYLKSKQPQSKV